MNDRANPSSRGPARPSSSSVLDTPIPAEVLRIAEKVRCHKVFERLRRIDDVRAFMEHHVRAVWDFMSLLKSIPSALVPAAAPCPLPHRAVSARRPVSPRRRPCRRAAGRDVLGDAALLVFPTVRRVAREGLRGVVLVPLNEFAGAFPAAAQDGLVSTE